MTRAACLWAIPARGARGRPGGGGRGKSHPGAFAPFIEKPEWTAVGRAPLPAAREISMERFASGIDDGLRVEVTGRVRRVFSKSSDQWVLIVSSGGHRFEATVTSGRPGHDPCPFPGWAPWCACAGSLAADYQLHRRGLAMVRLFVASSDDVVEQAEEIDPYHCEGFATREGGPIPAGSCSRSAQPSPRRGGRPVGRGKPGDRG